MQEQTTNISTYLTQETVSPEILNSLIEKMGPLQFNQQDLAGNTALHNAFIHLGLKIDDPDFEYLFNQLIENTNCNLENKDGLTPLAYIITNFLSFKGRKEFGVIHKLIEHTNCHAMVSYDTLVRDRKDTLLNMVLNNCKHFQGQAADIILKLIAHTDCNQPNRAGVLPLFTAVFDITQLWELQKQRTILLALIEKTHLQTPQVQVGFASYFKERYGLNLERLKILPMTNLEKQMILAMANQKPPFLFDKILGRTLFSMDPELKPLLQRTTSHSPQSPTLYNRQEQATGPTGGARVDASAEETSGLTQADLADTPSEQDSQCASLTSPSGP